MKNTFGVKMVYNFYHSAIKAELKKQGFSKEVAEKIDSMMKDRSDDVMIRFTDKGVLLLLSWDCLNMSIYNPDAEMCKLLEKLGAG